EDTPAGVLGHEETPAGPAGSGEHRSDGLPAAGDVQPVEVGLRDLAGVTDLPGSDRDLGDGLGVTRGRLPLPPPPNHRIWRSSPPEASGRYRALDGRVAGNRTVVQKRIERLAPAPGPTPVSSTRVGLS
ncbi:MAG TPA: hypothetical protein VGR26_06440, partial [Acidimicrobiales bacterium]|nr:hypothetical protein [Acidimicrobiales bacterium]